MPFCVQEKSVDGHGSNGYSSETLGLRGLQQPGIRKTDKMIFIIENFYDLIPSESKFYKTH